LTGLAELQDSAYAALQPVQWPVPKAGQSGGRYFANGGFSHPDGKARMLPITTPAVQPIPGQFRLNTDRIRDQWHTMTRTGKSPRLSQHLAEPYVEIHPTDAKRLGVGLAELVELRLPKGAGIYRAKISDSVQPGQLFAPMHWTRQNSTESWINAAVAAETDPVSGQPASNGGTVKAQKFEAAWYGYLVSTNKPQLMARYTALSKTHAGWQAEIADNERVEDWEAVLREMTGTEAGDISFFEDRSSGQARLAIVTQNQIQALLFVGPEPVSVARSFAASLNGRWNVLRILQTRIGGDASAGSISACGSMRLSTSNKSS